jgi:hypothetical protein
LDIIESVFVPWHDDGIESGSSIDNLCRAYIAVVYTNDQMLIYKLVDDLPRGISLEP